jgi:hypothetical protein
MDTTSNSEQVISQITAAAADARISALAALTSDDLFEAAVALGGHMEALRQIVASDSPGGDWQARLQVAQRAHERITAARLAA